MAMSVVYTTVNGQILRENRGGVVSDFVPDPLGSVVMVQDAAGAAVYRAEYDPYGNVQSETGTNPSSLGYVGTLGYIKDSVTSMYVRARYLLNNLGRWLTKDPLWPSEAGYVFAGSAPTMSVDPSGLFVPGGLPGLVPPKPEPHPSGQNFGDECNCVQDCAQAAACCRSGIEARFNAALGICGGIGAIGAIIVSPICLAICAPAPGNPACLACIGIFAAGLIFCIIGSFNERANGIKRCNQAEAACNGPTGVWV